MPLFTVEPLMTYFLSFSTKMLAIVDRQIMTHIWDSKHSSTYTHTFQTSMQQKIDLLSSFSCFQQWIIGLMLPSSPALIGGGGLLATSPLGNTVLKSKLWFIHSHIVLRQPLQLVATRNTLDNPELICSTLAVNSMPGGSSCQLPD